MLSPKPRTLVIPSVGGADGGEGGEFVGGGSTGPGLVGDLDPQPTVTSATPSTTNHFLIERID
jgi:hypothetical protein